MNKHFVCLLMNIHVALILDFLKGVGNLECEKVPECMYLKYVTELHEILFF